MKNFFRMYETMFLKTFFYGLLLGFIINFLFKESVETIRSGNTKTLLNLTPFEYSLVFMQRSVMIAVVVLVIVFVVTLINYRDRTKN